MIEFDDKPFIEAADILVKADETERALALLNNVPAFYRDNPTPGLKAMKSLILNKMTLIYDLQFDGREHPKDDEWSKKFMNETARGQELKKIVEQYNHAGFDPHIVDMGPGDATFAIGLAAEEFRFTYECFTLNNEAHDKIKGRLGRHYKMGRADKSPPIFVAYEIIEHLSNVSEIRQAYERIVPGGRPEYVLLSTPKYTFEKGTPDWKEVGIHHLRAYTPREFITAMFELFPEYDISFADSDVMVIIGRLKNGLANG